MNKVINMSSIVGARPQFIKAASVSRAIEKFNDGQNPLKIMENIIHTGQHYDGNMSKIFFNELKIPEPSVNLEVGSGLQGRQTGLMLERIEKVLIEMKPDWVVVYGDTNSTLAGALAASKLHIPVAHIEAGLRSFNKTMPEEINRIVTDHLSTLLFCPTQAAVRNLLNEGITEGVFNVGDVMYDSVLFNTGLAQQKSRILQQLKLDAKQYYLATIHRAENTDNHLKLKSIFEAFTRINSPVVIPLHPRTRKVLNEAVRNVGRNLIVIDPVSYLDVLVLEKNAGLILTDSGGVQKEAYWLKVPCVTLRDETEWVELVEAGYNQVAGTDVDGILKAVDVAANRTADFKTGGLHGDGRAAQEIVRLLTAESCLERADK